MKVKELKTLLANAPDEYEVCVTYTGKRGITVLRGVQESHIGHTVIFIRYWDVTIQRIEGGDEKRLSGVALRYMR